MDGKFLAVDGVRFLVKGVTYGTFAPVADGSQFPPPSRVADDFAAMVRAGINTVRLYTPPRRDILDAAAAAGLKLMVGLPWAQHVAFLDDRALLRGVRRSVVSHVRELAGHPAVLLFALGNEIPPGVVRWHGRARLDGFLRDLVDEARAAAPDALFTYVNFPPTEFLDLSPFDVCSFNVYLHREADLRAYLARLQQLAGPQPLLLAEAGADSERNGEDGQAAITAMHLRAAFAEGCAGAVAFAWTDEWWRGGQDVEDWHFGLVDAERRPKAALGAVKAAFADAPFSAAERAAWPRVSVVVCAYNAAETIAECLSSLEALTYPDYEVVVVNDGSCDTTGEIARRFPRARVIDVPNGGLSAARNIGLHEATGEIVAYTDADVRVDPDWLTYLVQPFLATDVVGSGGPNIVPADDPWLAQCVARSPGGPTHVLLDDRIAEHVPGCNMAFRRHALLSVGGFNPTYVKAGDDVDLCWRLQARGWRIGFAPSALVWHRHRTTLAAYWRQQVGYGEGESWLMHDHPGKFAGRHMIWHGRIYSGLPFVRSLTRARVNTGRWGLAPFPSVYHAAADPVTVLPHTAAWQVVSVLAVLAGASTLAFSSYLSAGWLVTVLGVAALGLTLERSLACALATALPDPRLAPTHAVRPTVVMRAAIAWLHLVQPWARVKGRVLGYLHPPEAVLRSGPVAPRPWPRVRELWVTLRLFAGATAEFRFWSERWHAVDHVLHRLTTALRSARLARRIEVDDGWEQGHDVSVPLGRLAAIDLAALVEEHAQGRVLTRVRVGLRVQPLAAVALVSAFIAIVLALSPTVVQRWPSATAAALIGAVGSLAFTLRRAAGTMAGLRAALAATADGLGATELDSGRPAVRFAPETPMLRFAARHALAVILVLGPTLGGGALLKEARQELESWKPVTPLARRVGPAAPPRWREPRPALAVAPNGDVYLADPGADVIRRVTNAGDISTVASTALPRAAGGPAPVSPDQPRQLPHVTITTPGGVAVAPSGDLYVADAQGHRVYRVDRVSGATVVVAGSGTAGFAGDGGPAAQAHLHSPSAVMLDAAGNVWIADAGNHRIRRVTLKGGLIETVAGGGPQRAAGDVGDGRQALDATLAWPSDLALTPGGDVYIADTEHHRVRRIDGRTGTIETVAGTGTPGSTGDGGPAIRARLSAPTGLALVVRFSGRRRGQAARRQTTVYVADSSNGRVRVVAPDGTISSLAVPAGLSLREPARLAYHPRGWLYVADSSPDRLTAFSLTGRVSHAVPLAVAPVAPPRPRVGRAM